MTYLFVFAHPDDETVACAGTIKQLTDAGEKVVIISTTPGDAGEVVTPEAQQKVEELGSVAALRQREFTAVCEMLGAAECRFLNFKDGTITNQMVWGELKESIIEVINEVLPDVIVTFEHTGWYYHLDHIGTSIATTLAYHQAEHRAEVLLLSHFYVPQAKWVDMYGMKELDEPTHQVDIHGQLEFKFAVMQQHNSQNLQSVEQHFSKNTHFEEYVLAFATKKGKQILKEHSVFQQVSSKI